VKCKQTVFFWLTIPRLSICPSVCPSQSDIVLKWLNPLNGTRWPSGTVPDFAIVRSWVRLPPVAAVYQRQFSVPSLWGRLMSTSESWGVNGHTTRCTSHVSVVLQLRLVSGWRLRKQRSAPPHGPLRLVKGFYFTFTLTLWPDAHCCHMGAAKKYPVPDRVKPSFVIFDIRALWRSALAWECPDVKNYKWRCFIAAVPI